MRGSVSKHSVTESFLLLHYLDRNEEEEPATDCPHCQLPVGSECFSSHIRRGVEGKDQETYILILILRYIRAAMFVY